MRAFCRASADSTLPVLKVVSTSEPLKRCCWSPAIFSISALPRVRTRSGSPEGEIVAYNQSPRTFRTSLPGTGWDSPVTLSSRVIVFGLKVLGVSSAQPLVPRIHEFGDWIYTPPDIVVQYSLC